MTTAPQPTGARSNIEGAHANPSEQNGKRRDVADTDEDFARKVDDARRERGGAHRREDTQPTADRTRGPKRGAPKAAANEPTQSNPAAPAPEQLPSAVALSGSPAAVALVVPTPTATPVTAEPTLGIQPAKVAGAASPAAPKATSETPATISTADVAAPAPTGPTSIAPAVDQLVIPSADRADTSAPTPTPPPAPAHTHIAPEKSAPPPPAPQEASPTLAHERAGEILRQLRMHLVPEQRLATIQLEPASLGRIAIRLALRKGHVDAQLRVEQRDTLDVLLKHVPELRAALERHGIHSGALDMQLGFQDRGGQHEAPAEARPQMSFHSAPPSQAMHAALARSLPPSNGVDTYA